MGLIILTIVARACLVELFPVTREETSDASPSPRNHVISTAFGYKPPPCDPSSLKVLQIPIVLSDHIGSATRAVPSGECVTLARVAN